MPAHARRDIDERRSSCRTPTWSPTGGRRAFFVDAGGPVEPLIEAAERSGHPDARAAHPHHFDHVCEVGKLRARWPDRGPDQRGQPTSPPSKGRRARRQAPAGRAAESETLTHLLALPTPRPHEGHDLAASSSGELSSPATRCSRTRSAGCARPNHTTFADIKHSIMDVLPHAASEQTVIRPGHTNPTTVADELRGQLVSCASGAG